MLVTGEQLVSQIRMRAVFCSRLPQATDITEASGFGLGQLLALIRNEDFHDSAAVIFPVARGQVLACRCFLVTQVTCR